MTAHYLTTALVLLILLLLALKLQPFYDCSQGTMRLLRRLARMFAS